MTDDLERRAHALLRRALDAPEAERAALVDAAAAGDPTLAARARTLLAALEASAGFLETPVLVARDATDGGPAAPPAMIGDYAIEAVLGDGGQATVYLAVQPNPRRRVALKVMKRGLAGTSAALRFAYETEVLARLRHPGIGQIFAAGLHEEGGGPALPYFAMELVEGARTITAFADAAQLDRRARLDLLARVCDAVQHGHQQGVIHRDLKPSNILVDAAGAPKVIDFGIARPLDAPTTERTMHEAGSSLVGTLEFMSPEQCGAGDGVVDVRSDVYALGVVLHELVCGRRPFRLSGVPLGEALRIVREERPPRPSALDPALDRDLEAVLTRAIDPDPERRYPSAAALATDLRRHLRHETVEARLPTLLDQCRLFARRNRRAVAAGALAAAVLALAAVVSTALGLRAAHEAERRRDAEEAATAERDVARRQAYVANVAAAIAAHETGEFRRMRARLGAVPEARRGWEWRMLAALADPATARVAAHDGEILAFDGDRAGRRLVTAGADGRVRLWDADALRAVLDAPAHAGRAGSAAFAPDGRRFAGAGEDGVVRVLDADDGAVRAAFAAPIAPRHVSFGADDRLAIVDAAGAGVLLDARDGGRQRDFGLAPEQMHGARFVGDGSALLAWGTGGAIRLESAADGAPRRLLDLGVNVECAATSADGAWIAAGGAGGAIALWDAERSEPQLRLAGDSVVTALAFAPDGRMLASGHVDRAIALWSLPDGARIGTIQGHESAISGLVFAPDGRRLHSAARDGTIRTWDVREPDGVVVLRGSSSRLGALAFSHDGTMLASAGADGMIRVWDPELGEPIAAVRAVVGALFALAFSPDDALVAVGGFERTIVLRRTDTGASAGVLRGHEGLVAAVAFAPDGTRLASAAEDGTVRLWSLPDGAPERVLDAGTARAGSVAWSPDGTLLASGAADGALRLWSAADGALRAVLAGHDAEVSSLAFTPDGAHLVSGSSDRTVRVWSVAAVRAGAAAPVRTLDAEGQPVASLAVHPDGSRIAAGSWYRTLVLWDLAAALAPDGPTEPVAVLSVHDDAIRAVAFSPDGTRLAGASADGTLRILDTVPRAEREPQRRAALAQQRDADALAERLLAEHGTVEAALAALAADPAADALRTRTRFALRRRAAQPR